MTPGDRLRAFRKQADLSAAELGRRAAMVLSRDKPLTAAAVRHHENGTNGIPADVAAAYARVLRIKPADILYGDGGSATASVAVKRLALVLLLASCGPDPADEAMAEMQVHMRAQTEMVRRGDSLHLVFEGECTSDCSGHRAGYLWAIDNPDVTHKEWCESASPSFESGCLRGLRAAAFE